MGKKDAINAMYNSSNHAELICMGLFVINVICSILSAVITECERAFSIVLIVVSVLYVLVSIFDQGILRYNAEKARRRDSIQNAFGANLSTYHSEGYYNNALPLSEFKYAVNLFESNYFTKEISSKMFPFQIVKSVVAIITFILTLLFIKSGSVMVAMTQSIFSSAIVISTIMFFIYHARMKQLFNEAYKAFITLGITKDDEKVWLKYYCLEYESIKAHYGVRLCTHIFNKNQVMLDEKWEEILKMLKEKNPNNV